MRLRQLAAALLVAVGAVAASAIPASAEPTLTDEQIDEVFTQQVQDRALPISVGKAKTIARATCDVLRKGGSIQDAFVYIQKNTSLKKTDDIGTLGGLAVQAYCPNSVPKS